MAIRRPLYYTGGDLQEMNDTQLAEIRDRAEYMYGADPSVDLAYTSSGGTLTPIMADYYTRSGTAKTSATSYPSESSTGEPTLTIRTNYDRINLNIESLSAPTDTDNKRYPVYYDGTDIVAMTQTDFYDTFITQAIDQLVASGDQPGTYRILANSTTLANHTNVNANPVFEDWYSQKSSFTAGGIGTLNTIQQGTQLQRNAYYLMRTDQSIMTAPTYTEPYYLTSTNDIQEYTTANFDTVLQEDIRYWATQTGSKLTYSINGSGVAKGSTMVDSRYTGSGTRTTRFVNANDYRAQEFPSGSLNTVNSWVLRLVRG